MARSVMSQTQTYFWKLISLALALGLFGLLVAGILALGGKL